MTGLLNKKVWWLGLIVVTAVTILLLTIFMQRELKITDGTAGAPLDDAWIHFQFARNIARGDGFSYNPGVPTPGSTAPLWTLILAGVGLFSEQFLLPALLLSALFLLLTVWLAYGFTFWLTDDIWPAFLAALGVAFAGRLLWAGLAGMETTAFAALSLAAIWTYSKWGLRPLPTLLFALATLLRPEGYALFGLAFADTIVGLLRGRDRQGATAVAPIIGSLLIYVVLVAPYSLFSLTTTGKPLPNTFYAKVGSAHLFSLRTLRETLTYHLTDNPVAFVLALVGLVPLWRRSRLATVWLVGLPLLTAVIIDFTWHHGRYTMPLIPLQMVAAGVGAHWLVGWLRPRVSAQGVRLVTAVAVLLIVVGGLWQLSFWATMLGNNAREILDIDVALGHWLAENTPPDALLAVDDIGAIAFLSERRIVDMNGLVSPEMWTAVTAAEGLPRNQALTRILAQSRPDYMVAFPLWRWDMATNTAVAKPIHQVQTATHTIIFQQDAAVYEMRWPFITADEIPSMTPVDVLFGDGIRLLGVEVAQNEMLDLTLYWLAETAVAENYDIFVHVLNESGEIVAQVDRQPLNGLVATNSWQPGDIIRDPLSIPLPPDLALDTYALSLGVYQRETGTRLPVNGNVDHDAVIVNQ